MRLAETNPYPIPDPLCGTMSSGDGKPDEALVATGAMATSSTFCGDETPVDELGAVQMVDSDGARTFVEDQVMFDIGEVVKTGQPERLGDIVCQSYTADGDSKVLCSAAVGRIVVYATGDGEVPSREIVDEGVAKMIAWIQEAGD